MGYVADKVTMCQRPPLHYIIFPIHPRTRKQIKIFGLGSNVTFCQLSDLKLEDYYDGRELKRKIHSFDPVGYLDFLNLMANAKFVLTDSGGIQEETTVLDIPCVTLRDTTERPITLTEGTNVLVKNDPKKIVEEALKILNGNSKKGNCPSLWDGHTAERIVKILVEKNGSGITEKLPVELKSDQTNQTHQIDQINQKYGDQIC